MRFVFFGTGSFAVPALRALRESVVLVVTQPDRPSGRGMKLKPSEIKLAAEELGLPVETPLKARDGEFVAKIEALDADALIVASYGQILSERLLNSAKHGGINLHGSLLPEYRGAAPIQRAILDGQRETGVTLMQMDRGMDTGDEIDRVATLIGPDETYGELQDRLSLLAADLILQWAPRIAAGEYPRTPQPAEGATLAPKIERAETELSVERSAHAEYDRFRAFTPSPGVFLSTTNGVVKISEARRSPELGVPGEVLRGGEGCLIAFEGGAIDLIQVQPEGKRRMSGKDFANGYRLRPGSRIVP